MSKDSFALNPTTTTQITFYYDNGHEEAFSLPIPATELAQQLSELFNQLWITFHLADQTVMINMAKVEKIEFKPPIAEIEGEGVVHNVLRITALHKGAVGRFKVAE